MDLFADRETQADAAAGLLARALATPLPRTLVVTGGSTPGSVYDRLARFDLDWAETSITLSDDRWVDETDPDSNAALVSQRLLVGHAATARFLPLKGSGDSPEADARAVEPALRALPPTAATLLGMGEDGHIASLFPTDPDLGTRLNPIGSRLCVGVPIAGLAPFVPRITLTVRALLETALIVLLITGETKRALVESVQRDSGSALPVAAILHQTQAPVHVLWAP